MLEGPPHLRTPGSPTCTLVLKISLAGPGGRQPLWSLATGTLWDSCPQPPGHKGSRSLFPCLIQTLRLETTCSLRRVFLPTQCRKCFLIYCQLVQLGKVLIKFPCLKPLNNQRMWPGRPRVLLGDRARGWGGGGTLPRSLEASRLSHSLPHSKLLHKRDSDKVDAQEENFLPKYQRVKDLCQRAEYQTACEQLGQVRNCGGSPRGCCPPSSPCTVPSPELSPP